MHPSLLLLRKLVKIDLDRADYFLVSLANPLAPIVRLAVEHLNFESVLAALDVEGAHLVPHWAVRLGALLSTRSVTLDH